MKARVSAVVADVEADTEYGRDCGVARRVVLADHDPVGFDPGVGGEGREPPRPTRRQTWGTTAPGWVR
jgi:hypothetical protein